MAVSSAVIALRARVLHTTWEHTLCCSMHQRALPWPTHASPWPRADESLVCSELISSLCRGAWHMNDHVPILQRLRWGEIGFANLRFQQTANNDLQFQCEVDSYRRGNLGVFDCSWVGNTVRPGGYQLRDAADIWTGNKDEWWDSVELEQVGLLSSAKCILHFQETSSLSGSMGLAFPC